MRKTRITEAVGVLLIVLALGTVAPVWADEVTEGCLQAIGKDQKPLGYCPLKHTEVNVDIAGFIARVTLTQDFGNPYEEPIEAVYTFPMSDRAAVDSMTMTIGDRVIKGLIKRREEAKRIYEAARDAGQAASLLDQERPNIFTQSVANILPGERILITISYVEYLKYEEGEYEYSFPMVVGPRYIPGGGSAPTPMSRGQSTSQVPDGDRITPPVTPEGTRAGHDISLAVRLDAGLPVHEVRSELHEVTVDRPSDSQAVVTLKNKQAIPNRDFVLKYQVAGRDIGDAVLTHAGVKGGFFTLILQPPERVAPEEVTPKEMMFIIDCSGSMRGFPIEKAKKTMRLCIEQMNPNDTFNLVSFAGGLGYCFSGPVANTTDNRRKALDYLDALEGRGGTEMMGAIRAALEHQNDPERLRIVCFMTDGFIGNDMAILDAIQKNAQTARVFSFGIGNGVNRFLIENMARSGRGAAEVVTLESDGDAAAERFHQRIHSPILTDITVDFGDLPIEDVYPDPEALPDLFAARPLVLKGRYTGTAGGAITVRGNTAAGPFERTVSVVLPGEAAEHDVLAPLWARARIDWLMARDWLGIQQGQADHDTKEAITQLGLDFGLVTQFTSFVAVEEKVITEGGKPKTVQVPVEMTDGVSYEGVFGEQATRHPARKGGGGYGTGGFVGAPQAPGKAMRMLRQSAGVNVVADSLARPMAEQAPLPAAAPAVVAEGARQSTGRGKQPETKREADEDKKGHPKLDRALWDLSAKLVDGNYSEGKVRVKNGWVEVFIRLADDSPERLKALRELGVRITSHAQSGKVVLAKVEVKDIEKLADLDFVKRIEPPRF